MEAVKHGQLVRQHHPNFTVKIACQEGSKYRIQRLRDREAYEGQKIQCPSHFVSRKHCEIFRKDRAYWIKDLGSSNGTFLNGIKLIENHDRELRFGDFIGIGVSHIAQEEHVNVKDDQYYIFLFKQEELLVIDLDDDEDEDPVNQSLAQEEVPANISPTARSDDDIEIIEEPISGCSSKDSNNSSHSSPEKKARKAMPPPPPPPIISKSYKLKMSPSTDSTKQDSRNPPSTPSTSTKILDNQVLTPSKSVVVNNPEPGTSSAADSKNKRQLKIDHHQQPVKRPKRDSSSSDDSSDGLGDCEEKVLTNGTGKKSSIYSGKSSEESSSDEKDFDLPVDDKPAWNVLSRDPELVRKKKKNNEEIDSRSHKRPTRVLNISDDDSNDEDEEEKRRKYEILKGEAKGKVGTSCTVVLERLIKYNRMVGKFELTRKTYDALEPVSRRRMQAQFRESLKRNQALLPPADFPNNIGNSGTGLKAERNVPASPESEDIEETMQQSPNEGDEKYQPQDEDEMMDVNEQEHDDDCYSDMDVDDNLSQPINDDDRTPGKFSNPSLTPIKPPEPVTPKPNSARKGIQLLADAPLPRHVVKAQIKNAAFKPPAAVTTPKSQKVSNRVNESPGVSYSMTREEQKRVRNEKLKELERKNHLEKLEKTPDRSPRKPPQPAKIKVTSRNRNEGLMDSIIQSSSKSTEQVTEKKDDAKNENQDVEEKSVQQVSLSDPRLGRDTSSRVMPRGDPRLNRPNLVTNRTKANQSGVQSSSGHSAPKTENISNILKPGAKVILSPPPALGKVAYRERDTPHDKPRLPLNTQPKVSEEDIYKRIAIWKPDWIEEQKHLKGQDPPLLKESDNLTLTLKRYESYDAYFKIYYPLLLLEIWASISNDYFNAKPRINDSRSDSRLDYRAKIEDVKRTPHCHLVKFKKGQEKVHGEDSWVNVKYHTWVQRVGEIDYRKDLTILTMQGTDKTSGKKVLKKVFGFPWDASKKYEPISRTVDCDDRLRKNVGNDPGCRFTETLVCRFGTNFVVDTNQLAHVARIHNISPKLREFRALNTLRSFRLFEHIVSPVESPDHSWQAWLNKHAAKPGPTHDMITLCRKLNMEQKSVVSYISQRISSNDPALMLLHGPPGTGKTTTIVALVLQLLVQYQRRVPSKTHRILICTPSNAAIDEIMRRLIREIRELPSTSGGNINLVRVGEGYAKELEKYSLNSKVKEIDEDKATTTSINVEIAAVREDINEVQEKIKELKKEENFCRIKLQSLLSELEELKKRDQTLAHDLKATKIKKNVSNEDNQTKGAMIIKKSNIVCSTLSSSGTSLMKAAIKMMQGERSFLCCIVDEASQTTEPETLLPLTLNIEKMLLVGDPHQLGATVLSNVAEEKQYGQSLFSRHYNFYRRLSSSPIMMLRRQYRMHEQIVKWPNAYFYDKQLQNQYNAPSPNYTLRPYYFLNLTGREHSEADGKIENTEEVQMVKALVETINEMLLPAKSKWTIGVITPYSAQKFSIIKAFQGSSFGSFNNVEIDTVDGFQGQERDIVILSCVRTDATGFLKSRNRLNVALTRARHSLFIIGDARCLSKMDMWNCLIKDAANDNNKFDVDPDFRLNLKMLKTLLHTNLKKK